MAANRIKGITIEIDGDTTKLTSSLKNVDKSLKETQSKLKDIDKLLKLDPGNTELLRQKFETLQTAISTTEERLKTLKDAQKEGMDPEQADALQREIIATEQDLKSLQEQMKDFGSVSKQEWKAAGEKISEVGGKIQEVGKKISEVGDGIKDFGTQLTTHVTGPLAALGGASIAAFNEVDKGLDIVVKKTGATGDTLASLQQSTRNLAQTIPTDFETAGNAIGEVNTRFGLMDEELEEVAGQFIKFAQLNDTDVVTSIDSVQKAMTAWGYSAEDAGDVLDVLNVTGQETGISVNSLSDALGSNVAILQDAGMDFLQAADFIGNLEKNGIDASTAMTGLKKATQNASAEGKTSAQALQELSDNIKNAETDAEAFNLASEVFGTKAGPALALALQEDRLSFEDLGKTWDEVGGNVETTFDNTLDPVDQLTTTMNSVKDTLADLGSVLQEMALPALEKLQEAVQWVKDKWESLDDEQKEHIVTIGLVVAAIGPAIAIIGTVISVVGSVVGAIGTVMTALGAVVGFLGGPLTIALGAIIAVGVLVWKNWDTIKAKAIELWTKLKETFENIKTTITTVWENIKSKITEKVDNIKTRVSETFNNIKTGITEKIDAIRDKVSTVFETIKSKIIDPIVTAKDKVKETIDKIKNFFDFKVSLPKISLPHFSISPKGWKIGDLLKGSIPKLGIDWYAKAMDAGMILDRPTIFGEQGGRLLAGGEAGREVVVGANSLMSMIRQATAGVTNDISVNVTINGNVDNYDALAETIGQKLQQQMARQQRAFS